MQTVLQQFGISGVNVAPLGNGLINTTWLVETPGQKFILQQINQQVFNNPEDIAFNIRLLADHLAQHHPGYLFTRPVNTLSGTDMVKTGEGYFRLFKFIEGSHTIDVVQKPEQAWEAARQFGKFSKLLSGLDVRQLRVTLSDFHNLTLRYRQFENALLHGNRERIVQAAGLISFMRQHKNIVDEFETCKQQIGIRCTHHDTKISNVLFDKQDKGLCVIDLDTVMPGYFISDVGDMMRTYLCPVSEEEKDFSKIIVRKEFYKAIVDGYLSEMGAELSAAEKQYMHYAGKFIIYMQALRFLTDHINDDVYYGAEYPAHNFVRAGNQVALLALYLEINPG